MPIYTYACEKCSHTMDALQKFSDLPLKECPECHEESLVKQLSTGTGFCLMGHGWHKPGMQAGSSKS